MSLFRVTVEYLLNDTPNTATLEEDFLVEAANVQMAKYFYHKYTHDNYGDVSRTQEDDHIHGIGDTFEHSIKEISATDYASGMSALRRL
jgi:hypothetical protein